ncbi:hypothetical protein DEQ92_18095 [Haloferax sp. Atlit-6N]|uniref:hypothetical protein n=1 Tax=Haloferax sp. Atlit-6N TaxID=2077205 RepID=UPI000E270EF8|nr:hypothetical protein [Haloferax sp. Atlit-6N]REA01261.1 hypothetical protein DEQ92_18095 [Haloferax sp. Atlit-6N]
MYDIQSARQRDGDAAEDRNDRVDEILNRPRLGYGESDPLVGDDYDDYLEQPDDLTTPEANQFVTELFAHPLVSSIDDAIQETTPATGDRLIVANWREAFERATELFGVSIPEDSDEHDMQDSKSRLTELLGDYPEDMRDPSNAITVSTLYAELGCSTNEIAEVFSDEGRNVTPNQIRAILRNVGLIHSNESEDSEPSHQLGGTSMSYRDTDVPNSGGNTGININSEAVARDPTVTVERGE